MSSSALEHVRALRREMEGLVSAITTGDDPGEDVLARWQACAGQTERIDGLGQPEGPEEARELVRELGELVRLNAIARDGVVRLREATSTKLSATRQVRRKLSRYRSPGAGGSCDVKG